MIVAHVSESWTRRRIDKRRQISAEMRTVANILLDHRHEEIMKELEIL
jgi:hypothetical protein